MFPSIELRDEIGEFAGRGALGNNNLYGPTHKYGGLGQYQMFCEKRFGKLIVQF